MAIGTEGGPVGRPEVDTAEVLDGLNDLLQLDHDAVGAYEIAIENLENREHAVQIQGFKQDHERHVRALNDLILALGGAPKNEPHATAPLKQALQQVAAAGGDRTLLLAWRANELQVMAKYDRYARKATSWPPEAKRLIDENALDEERHYQWVADLLSGSDAPELDVVNRLREGVTQVQVAGARAREKLEGAASTARIRAADGLEQAADKLEELAEQEASAEGIRGQAAEGAQRLARGLDSTASRLREGGEGDLRTTLEAEIGNNPGRSLIATFAIGFFLGRLIR